MIEIERKPMGYFREPVYPGLCLETTRGRILIVVSEVRHGYVQVIFTDTLSEACGIVVKLAKCGRLPKSAANFEYTPQPIA